jgi:hypothetical protein
MAAAVPPYVAIRAGSDSRRRRRGPQLACGPGPVEKQLVAHPRKVRMVDPQRHVLSLQPNPT